MDPEQRQQWQQTADRMTVFCLISLTIGAYIFWANLDQNGADQGGTAFPLTVVGVVHLLGGGIAIFNAIKTRNIKRNILTFTYFLVVLALAIWFISCGNNPF